MLKKILLTTTGAALIAAGGTYVYFAEEFEKQATQLTARLETLKPNLTFDKIEVNKYLFSAKLTNYKLSAPMDLLNVKDPLWQEISFSSPGTIIVCYNPLTKTLKGHFHGESQGIIHYGSEKKEYKTEETVEQSQVTLRFKDQIFWQEPDIKKVLSNITHYSFYSPAFKIIDAKTNGILVSHEGISADIDVSIPEKMDEELSVQCKNDTKNFIMSKDFFGNILGLMNRNELSQIKNQEEILKRIEAVQDILMDLLYGDYYTGYTEQNELDFKMTKGDFLSAIEFFSNYKDNKSKEKFEYTQLTHFPSIQFNYKSNNKGASGEGNSDIQGVYNQSDHHLKIAFDKKSQFSDVMKKRITDAVIAFKAMAMKQIGAHSSGLNEETAALFNISEKTMTDLTPDMASLGKMTIGLDLDCHFDSQNADAEIRLGSKDYKSEVTVHFDKAVGGKVTVELVNHAQFFSDLTAYGQKIFTNGDIIPILALLDPDQTYYTLFTGQVATAQLLLEQIGKIEEKEGKTVLKIEQQIPAGLIPNLQGNGFPQ